MFKRKDKDKDKDKEKGRDSKKSTSSAPDPSQEGYEQFDSMNPPDPILRVDEEMERSEVPQRGSAFAVTPERPSTSGSEQGVEPEVRERANTVDGATGEVREKAKKSSKWHRPGIVKKFYPKNKDRLPSSTSSAGDPPQLSSGAEAAQDPSCVEVFSPDIEEEMRAEIRAEVEAELREEMEARQKQVQGEMLAQLKRQFEANLEEEKRKMSVQTQAQIEDTKQKCDILLNKKAKNIQEKEAEITSLKALIEAQKEEIESLKAEIETQKVTIESQKTELVNLRAKIEEQANLKEVLEITRGRLASLTQKHHEDINVQRKKAIEELKYSHQQQLQELQEGLTQQMREGTREIADLREKLRGLDEGRAGQDRQLVEIYQERDRIRQELDKKCREVQDVLLAKEELEAELQDARERLTQETESRQAMNQNWELKYKQLSDKLQDLQTEGEMRVQELERQLREKEEAITVLQEEMVQKQQLSPPPPDYHTLKETCGLLERQILKLQTQIDQPLPSNVYHFSQQLSKYVDPEGESAETSTSRPVEVDNIRPILQAMGCGPEYKPRGYVIALFHAFNQAQSILLDYTKIGEVVQLKAAPGGHLDASDSGEEIEKSPYSSLNDVKVEVTEGNMTDADKLEVPNMLRESQGELEKLRIENKNLLERLKVLEELERRDDEAPALGDKLKDLKTKYLALHSEKMELIANKNQLVAERDELLEKLEERDNQLKQLRKEILARGDGPPTEHPNVERSLSVGDMLSPDDPKAEVKRLRDVLEERETKIHNLTVQLKTFEAVAGDKALQEKEIAELKEQLHKARAEIMKLSDRSELVQVYNSLRSEVAVTREDLRRSESEKSDLEVERDIWQNEMDAAQDNKRTLETQVAKLQAAVHFYETKYPQEDPESVFESSEQKDRQHLEQIKGEISSLQSTVTQKQAIIKNLTKCRATLENRLSRVEEERDRMAEQVVVLIAARTNLKGELSRREVEGKHGTEKVKEYAEYLQANLATEREEKERMLQEVQDLKDEIEARKHEVTILRQEYESKLAEKEAKSKWKAKEQNYQASLQDLGRKLKHQKHECEQRVMKLTCKLDDKTKELQGVIENAHERQQESDEYSDQLRQERDEMKMERDRFKEEREMLKSELNRVGIMYDEQKGKYKAEIEEEKEKMKDEMTVLEVKCSSLQDHVKTLTEEKEQLSLKLTALDVQWQSDKQQLETATVRLSEDLQGLKQAQTQAEAMRTRYQEERKKISLLQRDLQTAQEMLQDKNEEHKTHVEYLKAQYESAKLDQERELVLPLKREVEQLKMHVASQKRELEELKLQEVSLRRELEQFLSSEKIGDSQFAKTYRRMGVERNELRQELETLQAKYSAMMDELTSAKDLLIKHNILFSTRKTEVREQRQHPQNIEHEQPRGFPSDYNVRPYPGHGQQPAYPPTSSENRNYAQGQSFRHLGDDRPEPTPMHGYPSSDDSEVVRQARTESFVNRPPQENWQVNLRQKMVNKSDYLDKQGSSNYNLKQQQQQQQQLRQAAPDQAYLHATPGQQGMVQQVGVVNPNPAYHQQQQNVPVPVTNASYPPNAQQAYHDQYMQSSANMPGSQQPYHQDQYGQPTNAPAYHDQYPPGHAPGPTNAQSRDPAPPSPGRGGGRQEQPHPHQHHPPHPLPPTNVSPRGGRRGVPSGPQENVLMQGLDADISQAAADVRREVFTSMTSMEGGEEPPRTLPRLDSNLICPMCKRQFRIGQIQHFRSHVDTCQGQ